MTSENQLLPQVSLSSNGETVGALGLGCMGMSELYGHTDQAEAQATLDKALELGVTLFDTADMYGVFANEELLAPFIAANRSRVTIATKFGYARTPEHPDDWSINNRPEYIAQAAERSLQRLGIETIDLYYMHRRDPDVPLADSIGAMKRLVKDGKVRQLGLSAVPADELRAAHAIHPIAALQSEWSIFTRDIEAEIVPTAEGLGVTIVPYAPLGRGMLTGRSCSRGLDSSDVRGNFPRFSMQNAEANARLVDRIDAIASKIGATSAQVALAWLLKQASQLNVSVVPIPGTRKRHRLEENVRAASLTLDNAVMRGFEPLAAAVQGINV